MRTQACLECLAAVRARVDVPLVPMTYSSLLEAYGWERFAESARAAGATSLIVADLPAGERPELQRVQLVAPTSTDERLRLAAERPTAGSTSSRSPARPAPAPASPPRWPDWPSARGPLPATSRSTRASASRRLPTLVRPRSSPTASSSARGRSRRPRKARRRSARTSARLRAALDGPDRHPFEGRLAPISGMAGNAESVIQVSSTFVNYGSHRVSRGAHAKRSKGDRHHGDYRTAGNVEAHPDRPVHGRRARRHRRRAGFRPRRRLVVEGGRGRGLVVEGGVDADWSSNAGVNADWSS